jgi:truncated hemoglobin YjbI
MADLCTFDSSLTTFDSTVRTFDQTTCQAQQQVFIQHVGGGELSWEDYVTAEFRRKHLAQEIKVEERKLKRVEKQIVQAEQKLPSKHHEGILANLQRLAFRKDEITNRIEAMRVEMVPLERFLEAEIDDDDEEVMFLH